MTLNKAYYSPQGTVVDGPAEGMVLPLRDFIRISEVLYVKKPICMGDGIPSWKRDVLGIPEPTKRYYYFIEPEETHAN